MQIKQLMSLSVHVCGPDDSLSTAAKLMWDGDCGALPVVDSGGQVVGIITDRDICMAAYTQGWALSAIKVSTAMARTVYACRDDDSVDEAERIMKEKQVRRLPVRNSEGRLVGMISLNDIAREAATDSRLRRSEVGLTDVAATLAAICTPRANARTASLASS